MSTSSRAEFDKAVAMLAGDISSHCETLTPKDLLVPYLFRLDEFVPKVFVPQMPYSAARSENRTVPRVVTATTILGCLVGIGGALSDYLGRSIGESSAYNLYKLSGFEFEYGLSPNAKMVFDADYSDEMWLIAYNEATKAYKPLPWGVVFIHSVTVTAKAHEKVNGVVAKLVIKVERPEGVPLSRKKVLSQGHYLLELRLDGYGWGLKAMKREKVKPLSFNDEKAFSVMPIDAKTYEGFCRVNFGKLV